MNMLFITFLNLFFKTFCLPFELMTHEHDHLILPEFEGTVQPQTLRKIFMVLFVNRSSERKSQDKLINQL